MVRWRPLAVLGTAQFLMVLDTSVMNVSISQLVEDFDTEVTAIQGVITLYTLVMAAFMITGGKLGDMFGRRRIFGIGLAVYGVGSALTAVAPVLWVLAVGWSIIEGLGAALVLPALAALVGSAYRGRDRAVAYGVIGGLAGAGIAVGPLLGGWLTTYATWRLVFAGEVVLVAAMLSLLRWIAKDPPRAEQRARLDIRGTVLSAAGLALIVLGVLQSSSWGWLQPRNPPFTILGFAPTVFVIAAGGVLLGFLRSWENRLSGRRGTRERDPEPLVRFSLFGVPALRSGLTMLLSQNLILLGLFFVIPLYLQVVQGLDAFETGLRLLPVSILMLLSAMSGPFLGRFMSPRTVVRIALLVLLAAILWLLGTIDPHIDDLSFGFAMAVLGLGMGLLASQLGNVVQSSVGDSERSEVGGLQYTAQNLGSSLGTALIGSILISALVTAFTTEIEDNPSVSAATREEAGVRMEAGVSFVSADEVRAGAEKAGLPPAEVDAVVDSYAEAQLNALKAAILAAGGITLASLAFTRKLPTDKITAKQT
ncbi:MFS transporter [Streptomyces cocklensis]|uniref:Predicted arabinose efflux permease, MFS family n=1 Tax=Actinacidiphila cocklensis TaxID=887465 RepID=A0A9W4DXT2_9ACTN|nr:MFS transporter [Actinacidiphila cocklensis]MDD1061275.1 MFS transporter [Actinacidiphila cocklensis]CAG6395837.1 Predicted arabinose efflux permease, MFS family [Actinacidiphila cocklensis]